MVVVDWLFARETGADELDKQLRVEENHDCSWDLEKLLQTELMLVICGLLYNYLEGKN